jgi:HPt (histidine-containing phosphotransfer) domain-containing protein
VLCVESELKDLMPTYVQNRHQDAAEIVDALRRKDFDDVRLIGHTMAGSSEAYGLARLTRLGRELEQAARQHAAEDIGRHVDELRRYLRSLKLVYSVPSSPLQTFR